MTPQPDSKKRSTLHRLETFLIIIGALAIPFIARHVPTTKLFEILNPLIPACASFGPFFLLFGILFRTSAKPITAPWVATAFLVAGTAMITLALMHFLSKLPVN